MKPLPPPVLIAVSVGLMNTDCSQTIYQRYLSSGRNELTELTRAVNCVLFFPCPLIGVLVLVCRKAAQALRRWFESVFDLDIVSITAQPGRWIVRLARVKHHKNVQY